MMLYKVLAGTYSDYLHTIMRATSEKNGNYPYKIDISNQFRYFGKKFVLYFNLQYVCTGSTYEDAC